MSRPFTFAERLRASRCAKKMTVEGAAKVLKVSSVTIRNYEEGKTEPRLSSLVKLGKLYDRSVDYLIRGGTARKFKP